MRMFLVILLLGALAACSFKILQPVDDTESSWRQVETPPPGAASAPPAPMAPDVGY